MARVKQFADDLGISKNQAQTLINKGRSRKDGGSQILEKMMKPKKYGSGGSNKVTRIKKDKTNQAKVGQFKNIGTFFRQGKMTEAEVKKALREIRDAKKKGGTIKMKEGGSSSFPDLTGDGKTTQADILKGRGVPGFSRGGGMAIQGLGFKGVR